MNKTPKNNRINLRLNDMCYNMLKDMAENDMRTLTNMIEYLIIKENINRFIDEDQEKK